LALPMSFQWTVALGLTCSVVTLAAYMAGAPLPETGLGLVLGMLTLNVVLALVLNRANRLQRLAWAAMRAEHMANKELSEHRKMLQSILTAVPAPLVIMDKESGRLIEANDAARRFFGDVAIKEPLAIKNYLSRRDLANLTLRLQGSGSVAEFETQLRLPDGSLRNVLLVTTSAMISGTEAVLTVVVDITRRKEMEAHLHQLASTDPLTGLVNRTRFFDLATTEIKRTQRYGRPLAVIMLDIDFFKRINDTYGHETGDAALKRFADLCRTVVREQDITGRLGGEEFAILLPESDPPSALALADRLRATVAGQLLENNTMAMTISAGVSEVLPGETAVDAALSRADQALYAAKRSGRNRVALYEYAASSSGVTVHCPPPSPEPSLPPEPDASSSANTQSRYTPPEA